METPVYEPFNVKIRIEIAKLRKMSFKDKLEYIWEYYKPLLLAVAAFLIILGSVINTMVFNPPAQTALLIEWSAGFVFDEQLVTFTDVLTERLIDESDNEIVTATLFFDAPQDPQMQMAMTSRRIAMVSAGELDILIQNSEQLTNTTQIGMIMPLDAILAEIQSKNPMIWGIAEERLIYALHDPFEDGGEERIMGIDISGSSLLGELDFYEGKLVFSVVTNSGRLENVTNALILLLESV